ncbi:hypothetical protein PCAR4_300027 [Paraburkholderia caribensis]|nr:hypothetical protein PCAR4_300027 [Paraburkholderia caribensis]
MCWLPAAGCPAKRRDANSSLGEVHADVRLNANHWHDACLFIQTNESRFPGNPAGTWPRRGIHSQFFCQKQIH